MAALQKMVGGVELTEDTMRSAIASLTPSQRRQLMMESQDLKRDLMTKQEHKEDRNLYFKEVNRSADMHDLPVDKDGSYLAKKVRAACLTEPLLLGLNCQPRGCSPGWHGGGRASAMRQELISSCSNRCPE